MSERVYAYVAGVIVKLVSADELSNTGQSFFPHWFKPMRTRTPIDAVTLPEYEIYGLQLQKDQGVYLARVVAKLVPAG
jgi:hypothetical protein